MKRILDAVKFKNIYITVGGQFLIHVSKANLTQTLKGMESHGIDLNTIEVSEGVLGTVITFDNIKFATSNKYE